METLPESVLAQIFENLSTVDRIRAEGVSHRWMEVLQGGGGWACQTSLSLSDFMEVACFVYCACAAMQSALYIRFYSGQKQE